MDREYEQAAELLEIIWRGISADYKSRYRMSIWQQFENNIRSAAYTSNLGKFLNSFCLKLSANIGRNSEDRARADAILQELDAKAMLKLLREETTLLVLMVCVANQERREAWEAEHPKLTREGESEDALF
jgi:hypothetical protein